MVVIDGFTQPPNLSVASAVSMSHANSAQSVTRAIASHQLNYNCCFQ